MLNKTVLPIAVTMILCLVLVGCNGTKDLADTKVVEIPEHIRGTVAEYAGISGGGNLPVHGYGIVIRLGKNGSKEVPTTLLKTLKEYLLKHKIGSYIHGTEKVSPERILHDLDTAVVEVRGVIPSGAPVGTKFDVFVSALPQTQTRSLDGGILMPIEMQLALGGVEISETFRKSWAKCGGPVFVNPFLDPTKPTGMSKLREGRIIGGARVLNNRPIQLMLRKPDYSRANQIQRRINQRFSGKEKVANATGQTTVEIVVPQEYRNDYPHFLSLLLHLPLGNPREWDLQAREIAKLMNMPSAQHDDLSLIWEAMGREIVPIAQEMYTSENPNVAFYSARAGLRLGDRMALDVISRFAKAGGSPLQVPAIEELGRHSRITRSIPVLNNLLDGENELVRIAAYEALLKHGNVSRVKRIDVGGQFKLDIVTTRRNYVIYATQTQEPRIVLLGRDMTVAKPMFFNSPDDMVTINAFFDSEKLNLFRKIPRSGTVSETFKIDFSVRSLTRTMGMPARLDINGNVEGLGLTYSQVVGVLHRLCNDGHIRAKFVLQQLPGVQRIYRGIMSEGRPDVSGDE